MGFSFGRFEFFASSIISLKRKKFVGGVNKYRNGGHTLHEGNYSAVCRIVVECIARPLTSAFSRIINSYLVLPKGKR